MCKAHSTIHRYTELHDPPALSGTECVHLRLYMASPVTFSYTPIHAEPGGKNAHSRQVLTPHPKSVQWFGCRQS